MSDTQDESELVLDDQAGDDTDDVTDEETDTDDETTDARTLGDSFTLSISAHGSSGGHPNNPFDTYEDAQVAGEEALRATPDDGAFFVINKSFRLVSGD